MVEFTFYVHEGTKGSHIVVTRLKDGKQKYFFQTGKGHGISKFMESMTDELCEGYWPKPKKKKDSDILEEKPEVDNWAFLGHDPDRAIAVDLAAEAAVPAAMALVALKLKG
jgi:hypothetical protein